MGSGARASLAFVGGLFFTAAIAMATQFNFVAISLGTFASMLLALREGFTSTGHGGAEKMPTNWLWFALGIGLVLFSMVPIFGAFSVSASSSGGSGAPSGPSGGVPTGTAPTCANPCVVVIRNSQFGSASQLQNGNGYVVVKVGTKVVWQNKDTTQHTSTSNLPGQSPGQLWDSGILNPGQSFSSTFNTPGTFPYLCNVHPMSGTVVVVP